MVYKIILKTLWKFILTYFNAYDPVSCNICKIITKIWSLFSMLERYISVQDLYYEFNDLDVK